MANELIRTEGNVFVSVAPPAPVKQATQAKRFYREWTDVANTIASEIPTPEPEPKQTLAELLTEVDAILNPPDRVNTQPIDQDCYHYSGYTVKPKTNPDSPLMLWWQAERHRRSDAEMEYRKSRGVA